MTPEQRRGRDRAIVWGSGAAVSLLCGCYGWSPITGLGPALATVLVVSWWLDGRPRP